MKASADLEIGLHRYDAESYSVELRFSHPESDADVRLVRQSPALMRVNLNRLRAAGLDSRSYGKLLGEYLLGDAAIQSAFRQAYTAAQSLEVPLRVRLFIGPSAPELHHLRWETLCDPQDHTPLLTNENILFSRYLSSLDWRPVHLRARGELRALVVVANPSDLSDYMPGGRPLAPIDVTGELERAEASLEEIPMTGLASAGSASLETICERLRDGYDIFYLVCHGALIDGEPKLWLEDESGKSAIVSGGELVTRLRELQQRPSVVVLASCQSAGSGSESSSSDGGVLTALGPQLAEAGIPAVLAMQGNVTMTTLVGFMPTFFKELRRDGQIDRAIAAARGRIRDRPDWWAPVLFMRLRTGRIWYVPGFADDRQGFERWPAILRCVRQGRCTPILGPGLLEFLLGSSREIAQRWAETYHFPMSPYDRDNLPQVAQYLAVNQDERFPRDELMEYLGEEIRRRYGSILPKELNGASLERLIEAVGAHRRATNPVEPHKVLAELPVPIYITTNPDNLLEQALIEAGKEPQVALCPWNEYVEQFHSIYDEQPDYRPTPERPLIYHLFGHLRDLDSVVLTEDDYFDYLIGLTGNKELIPTAVRRALADSALLFLGFQMNDWNFRVLFRSLMGQEGRRRRRRYAHVAVQIDPEEGRILEPERARHYLESYFQDADVSIYWGRVDDFVNELVQRVRAEPFPDILRGLRGAA